MRARVAIDANVLFAALLSGAGASRRLLMLGTLGIYEPVITAEVLAELDRHCRVGFKGRPISDDEVQAFKAAIRPLLDYEEVLPGAVGRAASERAHLVNIENRLNIREAPPPPPLSRGEGRRTRRVDAANVELRDMGDAHVLASAVKYRCDYLCTANSRDFPEGLEVAGTRVITPQTLLAQLIEEGAP